MRIALLAAGFALRMIGLFTVATVATVAAVEVWQMWAAHRCVERGFAA